MATQRQLLCDTLFQSEGLSPEGSAAAVGNWCGEVGPNLPTAIRFKNLDHNSRGGEQWRDSEGAPRWTRLCEFIDARHPDAVTDQEKTAWHGNMAEQVKFAVYELKTWFPTEYEALRRGGDVAALTEMFCWKVENPNRALARLETRKKYALDIYAAGNRVNPKSPITKANEAASDAKKQVNAHNGNAGIGIALGGLVATLHAYFGMPGAMAWTAGGIVAALILYSLLKAQEAAERAARTIPAPMPSLPAPAVPQAPPAPLQVTIAPADLAALAKQIAAEIAAIDHQEGKIA